MKKIFKSSLSILALSLLAVSASAFSSSFKEAKSAQAENSTLPKENITLRDNSEGEIRSYYSALNSKAESERSGSNLLKNLKPILKEGMKYYSYDNVWKAYEITDRDWTLSPAENDNYSGTIYDAATLTYTKYTYGSSSSNPGNDPYVHTLYRDRSNPDARIKEWGAHSGANSTNREHVWCQSRGFKGHDGSAAAYGPAGTDLHHLISGDGKVNTNYHNDLPYGNVDKTKTYKDASAEFAWLAGNLVGTPIKTSPQDTQVEVFEPRDEDKGDIARACFYMVARYNNLAGETGVISDYEPNLALADYATGTGVAEYSTDTKPVYMGIMSDLLAWNALDPVDDYEIHRNNLIFNNYQSNRNPFIDFPEWANIIWGGASGYANPASDAIAVGENGPRTPENPSSSVPTSKPSSTPTSTPSSKPEEPTSFLDNLTQTQKILIIGIAVGVVVIVAIVIIVLVVKGKVKVKVTKKGKVKIKPVKTKKKTSSSSKKKK